MAEHPRSSTEVADLVSQMTIDEKCAMLVGDTAWTIPGCERLGIPEWAVSDGPAGVRGRMVGPGLLMPGPSALAATWDPALIEQVGQVLGHECLDKNVDLLLGPTVNMHRHPRGGRHFESYSEDPELSSRIAVAFIRGVQSTGVGACVKHFVANDQETDRFNVDVRVDEAVLREMYLPPFEAAVRQANVRSVMAAYNKVNGVESCEHHELLDDVLRGEWGFDGIVISDWYAIKRTVEPALGGLDVEMPGPGRWWGDGQLLAAVTDGRIDESVIDAKVSRVLEFLDWRCRLRGATAHNERPIETDGHRAVARRAAAESIVLVRNRNRVLPLAPTQRVAWIGPGVASTALLGGGSASLIPYRGASLLDALHERGVDVVHAEGTRLRRSVDRIADDLLDSPIHFEVFAGDGFIGQPVAEFERPGALHIFMRGTDGVWPAQMQTVSIRGTCRVRVERSGDYLLMGAANQRMRTFVDGTLVVDNAVDGYPYSLGLHGGTGSVHLDAGIVEVTFELTPAGIWGMTAVELGLALAPPPDTEALDEAVRLAADADVAVVVVGTSSEWESEGIDRASLQLPGRQDDLVRAVLAANPNTVVVVNSGSPVTMPWLNDVAAAMIVWYPGQEGAAAIADVLYGAEPAGRMPTTWAADEADVPTTDHFPGADGTVTYAEGRLVGYRGFDHNGTTPLIPFGHGLSYTDLTITNPTFGQALEVEVANTGERRGCAVVQVYVAPHDLATGFPPKELAGFAKVWLEPGQSTTAAIDLRERAFQRWDVDTHSWRTIPGTYDLLVATSAADIHHRLTITI